MVILTLAAWPTWAILYFTFSNRERERVGSGQYRIFDTLMGTLCLYLILNSQNANVDARGTCWREHQAGCPLITLIVQWWSEVTCPLQLQPPAPTYPQEI